MKKEKLTKKDFKQLKEEVILFSLLTTKNYIQKEVLVSDELNQEDRSLAEDMLFFINWILKEDYPEQAETISKPDWNELKDN